MKSSEIGVPLKSLAIGGDTGGDVAPAVGDEGDLSAATYKVNRIEGDKAYITLTSVNGEPVATADAAPEKEPTLDEEETSLRADSKKSDRIY